MGEKIQLILFRFTLVRLAETHLGSRNRSAVRVRDAVQIVLIQGNVWPPRDVCESNCFVCLCVCFSHGKSRHKMYEAKLSMVAFNSKQRGDHKSDEPECHSFNASKRMKQGLTNSTGPNIAGSFDGLPLLRLFRHLLFPLFPSLFATHSLFAAPPHLSSAPVNAHARRQNQKIKNKKNRHAPAVARHSFSRERGGSGGLAQPDGASERPRQQAWPHSSRTH